MYKGTTNYNFTESVRGQKWLAIAVALLIFSKNSSSLNIFSTREDSTVKKRKEN